MSHRALYIAVISLCAATVSAVVCTTTCANTLFSAANNICDQQSITVTGVATGVINGFGVYDIATTNIQRAVVHMGYAVSGQTVSLYLYYAGPRTRFYGAKHWGFTSSYLATPGLGVFISNSSTCPTITTNSTPVHAAIASNWYAPTFYGHGYYRADGDVASMFTHAYLASPGGTVPILYIHDIGMKNEFWGSFQNTITTSASVTPFSAIWLTTSSTMPTDHTWNSTRVTVTLINTLPTGGVTGAGNYHYSSKLDAAVLHAGYAELGMTATVWIHHIPSRLTFFASKQYDILSVASVGLAKAFRFELKSDPPIVDTNITRIDNFACDSLSGGTLSGTGAYLYTSNLAKAAFHAGLIDMHKATTVYVHDIGYIANFYASTSRGIASTYNGPNLGVYISASPMPPTNSNWDYVKLRFTGSAVSIWGTGYYSVDSDLALAAFHQGLLLLGETKYFFVSYLGMRNIFYSSSHRGIVSTAILNKAALALSETPGVPADVAVANQTWVNLTASQHTGGSVVGTTYYLWNSDLTRVAMHMGMLRLGETARLVVHNVGSRTTFVAATNNLVVSTFQKAAWTEAITLQRGPTLDVGSLIDASYGPLPVNFTYETITTGSYVQGSGVFSGSGSDAKWAAVLDFRINLGETRQLWLHPVATPIAFLRTRSHDFTSGSSTTSGGYSFMFSDTSVTPADASLPASNIIPLRVMYMGPEYNSLTLYGAEVYHYNSDLAMAAFHAGLIDVGQVVTVYAHVYAAVPRFYAMYSRGIQSVNTAGNYGFRLTLSPTPPPVVSNWDILPVTIRPNKEDSSYYAYGTVYYSWGSDLGVTAMHARLLHYNESGQLYVHNIGTMNWFYASTSGTVQSYGSDSVQNAYMLSTSATPVVVPTANPLQVTLMAHSMPPGSYVCLGTGYYSTLTDLTMAALHNNLMANFDDYVTLYVHRHAARAFLYGGDSRLVSCGNQATPAATIYLSTDSTPPSHPNTVQFATVTIPQSVNTFYGCGMYYQSSDTQTAALHQGLGDRGSNVSLYIHDMGVNPLKWYACTMGAGITSSYTTATTVRAFYVSLSPTPPAAMTTVWYADITLRSMPPAPTGFGYYDAGNSVSGMAYHYGILPLGVTRRIYVHVIPNQVNFYAATYRGLTSASYFSGAMATVMVSLSSTPPVAGDYAIPSGPVCPDRYDNSITGAGYYLRSSDLATAALRDGLMEVNETLWIWAHNGGGAQFRLPSCFQTGQSNAVTNYIVIVRTTSTPPTVVANRVPINVTLHTALHSTPSTGYIYGVAGIYLYNSDVCRAAYHAGLIDVGETKIIYAYAITNWLNFFAATNRGVTSEYSINAAPGVNAWQLSLSSTAPGVPTANPLQVTFQSRQVTSPATLYGAGYYRETSDMFYAAVHAGFAAFDGASYTVYLHHIGNLVNPRIPPIFQNGVTTTEMTSGTYGFVVPSSTATVPPACMKNVNSQVIKLRGNYDGGNGNVYHTASGYQYYSDASKAAVMQGIVASGSTRTVQISNAGATQAATIYYQNGIVGVANAGAYNYYTMAVTAACVFPFPADENNANATCQGLACAPLMFPSGITTPVNTQVTVTLMGDHTVGSGLLYGTGYYLWNTNWQVAAVHAGVLRAGQTGTVYVTFVGSRSVFYGSHMRGIQGYTTGSGYGVYFSSTNTLPSISATYVPVSLTFHRRNGGSGCGIYGYSLGEVDVAGFMERITNGEDPWTGVPAYIHTLSNRWCFLGCNRGGYTMGSINISSQPSYMVTTSTTSPVDNGVVPMKVEYISPMQVDYNSMTVNGVQYYSSGTRPVAAAFLERLTNRIGDVASVYAHSSGWRDSFPGHIYLGMTSSGTDTSGYSFTVTVSSVPDTVQQYSTAFVSGVFTKAINGIRGNELYGIPGTHSPQSTASRMAAHHGFIRPFDPTSTATVYIWPGPPKNIIHSQSRNSLTSMYLGRTSAPRRTVAMTLTATPPAHFADNLNVNVTRVDLTRDFPSDGDLGTVYGSGYFRQEFEVKAAALSAGLLDQSLATGPLTITTVYAIYTGTHPIYGSYSAGIRSSDSSSISSQTFAVLSTPDGIYWDTTRKHQHVVSYRTFYYDLRLAHSHNGFGDQPSSGAPRICPPAFKRTCPGVGASHRWQSLKVLRNSALWI